MDISSGKLNKWADVLLDYSLKGIKSTDMVFIKGEGVTWPLISVLQEKILKAGGMADICLTAPDNERGKVWSAAVEKFGKMANLKKIPAWQRMRYEAATKSVLILGMEYPELTRGSKASLKKKIMQLDVELRNICRKKPCVITMYPTPAFAGIEGLPFSEYKEIVVNASVESPIRLKSLAESLAARLSDTSEILIETVSPHRAQPCRLRMLTGGKKILTDMTGGNIPNGEVYTSPDARSVEGEIFLDMPFSSQGDVIRGIYLKFAAGRLVSYRADKGNLPLAGIINTDKGARRLGEVAFGINPGLKTALMHPLFCEKLAGTMHLALGYCFPKAFGADGNTKRGDKKFKALVKTGEANVSAQHVDLVVSFRPGGAGRAVFLDGKKLALKNGNWAP